LGESLARDRIWKFPEGGGEGFTTLIQGQGVDGVLYGFGYRSVNEGKVNAVVRCFVRGEDTHSWDAQGSHGVIACDSFDSDVGDCEASRLQFRYVRYFALLIAYAWPRTWERNSREVSFVVGHQLIFPILENGIKVPHSLRSDQAHIIDEGGNASCCETTTRKTYEKDLITGLLVIVCSNKLVGLANMLGQAYTEDATNPFVENVVGTDAGLIKADLGVPSAVMLGDAAGDSSHVGGLSEYWILRDTIAVSFEDTDIAVLPSACGFK
jgi:hypothetical protein